MALAWLQAQRNEALWEAWAVSLLSQSHRTHLLERAVSWSCRTKGRSDGPGRSPMYWGIWPLLTFLCLSAAPSSQLCPGPVPEVQTPHLSAASSSPLPFSPPHSHTTGQPHAKGLPSLSAAHFSCKLSLVGVFCICFFFFAIHREQRGGHKPKGRRQDRADKPGRRSDATHPHKVLRGW